MTMHAFPDCRYSGVERVGDVPDAWEEESKTTVGYETPLSRHFFVNQPPDGLTRSMATSRRSSAKSPNC